MDLDFPAVYRAVAPLDAIVQAAGRCNREGRLPGLGRVVVFNPADGGAPGGPYRAARDIALQFLRGTGRMDSLEVLEAYYRRLLTAVDVDPRQIQTLRAAFNYPEVARRYRVIEEDTEPAVITGHGTPEERATVRRLIEQLRSQDGSPRYLLRALQPYVVAIRTTATAEFRARRLIEEVVPGVWEWTGGYDAVRGIQATPSAVLMV
ncbi:MAG: hypothetical protein EPO65_02185 [Dehalococcoidia bacterium]|nr:MAG: hypothetical protein EPO65_02185 [Dehalococcoidia bacterium]